MCTQIDEDVLLKPIGKEDSKKGVQVAVNQKKRTMWMHGTAYHRCRIDHEQWNRALLSDP